MESKEMTIYTRVPDRREKRIFIDEFCSRLNLVIWAEDEYMIKASSENEERFMFALGHVGFIHLIIHTIERREYGSVTHSQHLQIEIKNGGD